MKNGLLAPRAEQGSQDYQLWPDLFFYFGGSHTQQYSEAGPGTVLGDCFWQCLREPGGTGPQHQACAQPIEILLRVRFWGFFWADEEYVSIFACGQMQSSECTYRVGKFDIILLFCFGGHTKQ